MTRQGRLLLAMIVLAGARATAGLEPPGPWDPHDAVLSAGCVVRYTMVGHALIDTLQPPRVLASCTVVELLRNERELTAEGDTILVLLPPIEPWSAEPLTKAPWNTWTMPLFAEQGEILAALDIVPSGDVYGAASPWWYLAFRAASDSTLDAARSLIRSCRVSAAAAKRAAAPLLDTSAADLVASIRGGTIEGGCFVASKNVSDTTVQLFWRVRAPGSPRDMLVACDGSGVYERVSRH